MSVNVKRMLVGGDFFNRRWPALRSSSACYKICLRAFKKIPNSISNKDFSEYIDSDVENKLVNRKVLCK